MIEIGFVRATHAERARCGRPSRIPSIVREHDPPGPISTKSLTPSEYADSMTRGKSMVAEA